VKGLRAEERGGRGGGGGGGRAGLLRDIGPWPVGLLILGE